MKSKADTEEETYERLIQEQCLEISQESPFKSAHGVIDKA